VPQVPPPGGSVVAAAQQVRIRERAEHEGMVRWAG
jgi:hypothetical protein